MRGQATRRMVLAGLAALPAVSLTGCGGRGAEELQFWAMGNEAAAMPDMLKALARPASAMPVKVQPLPWSAAHEKLLTGFAGGALPDMAQIGNSWVAELAALDAVEPLPQHIAAMLAETGAQFPAVLDTNRIDGALRAVPWYVDTRLHFYRRDLFAKAGYAAPPLSWPEWKAALHKVKAAAGQGNYAILMPLNEYEHLTTFALSNGAALLRDNGTRGAFATPEFEAALAFYKSLYDEGLAPIASATQISNVWHEFERGFFSVYPSGPWTIGDMQERLPADFQDKWGTAPNPGPTGIGAAAPGGSSLVVFKTARHKDAAWDLIAALMSDAAQLRLNQLTGDLPAARPVWDTAGLVSNAKSAAFATQLSAARALPKVPEWERIVSEMQVVAERMVRGQFTVAQAAREMDKRADRLLEKRRWMLEKGA